MFAPILPAQSIEALRGVDAASLSHLGYRGTLTETKDPGGRRTKTWIYSADGVPARLNPESEANRQAADEPASVQRFTLKLEAGTAVKAGEQWKVEGELNGDPWSRIVVIERVLFPSSRELSRRAIAVDVELNP